VSIIVSASASSNFVPVPSGTHLARCYRIIDLGTQKSEYQGEIKYQPKIMIQFEVHGEDAEGQPITTNKGEPMSISKNYTLSLHEKAGLRKDLQSWRGKEFTDQELKGFELKNLLGAWCMINVVRRAGRDGKDYTNIEGIMPVPAPIKKMGLPDGVNDTKIFSLREPDMELFKTFSDNMQFKIRSTPEWNQTVNEHKSAPVGGMADMEDDIPF
jgi:hypothetical protein